MTINRFSLDCPYEATEVDRREDFPGITFLQMTKTSQAWLNQDSAINLLKTEAFEVAMQVGGKYHNLC